MRRSNAKPTEGGVDDRQSDPAASVAVVANSPGLPFSSGPVCLSRRISCRKIDAIRVATSIPIGAVAVENRTRSAPIQSSADCITTTSGRLSPVGA